MKIKWFVLAIVLGYIFYFNFNGLSTNWEDWYWGWDAFTDKFKGVF